MRAIVCVMLAMMVMGCSTIESITPSAPKPWVKPYERQNLADEVMTTDRFPLDDAFMSHLRASREGSRGAEGGGGGGCGCN